MKYLATDSLTLRETAIPAPAAHEVRIRVHATALNRADLLQRAGKYPPPAGASDILGLEVSGEIESVGEEVKLHKVGERVAALLAGGGYAEYVTVHEALAFTLPEDLSWEQGAAIPEAFLTAYHALSLLAQTLRNESVLIHAGASGVGTAAIQLMRHAGANIWVTASAEKHEACRALGATHTIDYRKDNFSEFILTYSTGVDVILDTIGAPYWEQNLRVLRPDGRMVMLAAMGGARLENTTLAPLLLKRLSLFGSTLRNRPLSEKIALVQSFWRFARDKFQDKTFVPVIDSVFDWREAATAHERMAQNLTIGKIVLRVSS